MKIKTKSLQSVKESLDSAIGIIETADNRAMAADGPVSHVRDEMSDTEWRQLYLALIRAHSEIEKWLTQNVGQ